MGEGQRLYNRVMVSKDAVEQALRAFFAREHRDLAAAYLFGSVARGTPRQGSDVDIAVLYARKPPTSLPGSPWTSRRISSAC